MLSNVLDVLQVFVLLELNKSFFLILAVVGLELLQRSMAHYGLPLVKSIS
jgi:hypothetical protein